MSTFLIYAGGGVTPVMGRPGRQADTPRTAQGPRFARRDAQGCLRLRLRTEENPEPLDKPPEKAKPPEVRTRAASEVNFAERPLSSFTRLRALVNLPGPAACHGADRG